MWPLEVITWRLMLLGSLNFRCVVLTNNVDSLGNESTCRSMQSRVSGMHLVLRVFAPDFVWAFQILFLLFNVPWASESNRRTNLSLILFFKTQFNFLIYQVFMT